MTEKPSSPPEETGKPDPFVKIERPEPGIIRATRPDGSVLEVRSPEKSLAPRKAPARPVGETTGGIKDLIARIMS